MTPSEQLCLACGLCCDGTLFDSVKLGPGDDAKGLKALGLPVVFARSKASVTHFRQPCAALCADCTCRIYADRPQQCRTFECGVFKDHQGGRIEFAAALRLVRKARREADKIRRLLRELGDTDETVSLNERFRRMRIRMEAGTPDAAAADVFAELSLAVHSFSLLAHDRLYTKLEI